MAPRKSGQAASWEINADQPKPEGETRPRRSYCVKELVTSPAPGIQTIHDILLYAARTHTTKPALASRPIKQMHTEVKKITKKNDAGEDVTEDKKWEYYELGKFEWVSYSALLERVRDVGIGLKDLGVGSEGEEYFNIYGQTSLHWQLLAHACAFSAVPICTAYDSLGPAGLSHALSEPNCRSMFINSHLVPTLLKIIDEVQDLKLVVYDGDIAANDLEKLQAIQRNGKPLKVITLEEVESAGRAAREGGDKWEGKKANPDDIYCVMYTSGSTGAPKGVMLTHKNIVAAVGAVWHLLYEYLTPEDTFLAFLPLAHILEFVVETSWIFAGISIGYGRIKTLTEASVRHCKGDIAEFKPSIMVGVPAVWELIRKGIVAKVEKSGGLKKGIFNKALGAKQFARDYKIPGLSGLTDKVVFNAVKAQTGGRLKIALSGGGSISASTQEFISNAVVQLIQGYGLTESVAMATVLHPAWFQYGVAGCPMPSTEIKLVDAKEAGYISTNDLPQGEIYLRGPSVAIGYFKRPDLNKESFTEDGWFKTGDIGQWNPDGTLSIVDRIKNLVKLSGGEYIAVEKLESVYKSCSVVGEGMILANPQHRQPAMIVCVHHQNFPEFCRSRNLGGGETDLERLCKMQDVERAVLSELNSTGKKQGFGSLEMLESVILTPDEWLPGFMLTAARKIQRKEVTSHYKEVIDTHYK